MLTTWLLLNSGSFYILLGLMRSERRATGSFISLSFPRATRGASFLFSVTFSLTSFLGCPPFLILIRFTWEHVWSSFGTFSYKLGASHWFFFSFYFEGINCCFLWSIDLHQWVTLGNSTAAHHDTLTLQPDGIAWKNATGVQMRNTERRRFDMFHQCVLAWM